MDLVRNPYDRPCKFFKDSDQVDTISWYECQPDAPALDFESAFCSQNLELDPQFQVGVGEVLERFPKHNFRKAPPGATGKKVCGTPEQFSHGTTHGSTPPVPRQKSGLLGCCGRAPTMFGGAVIGGKTAPVPPVIPGPTCLTAGTLPFEQNFSGTISGLTTQQWFTVPALSDTTKTYYVRILVAVGSTLEVEGLFLPCPIVTTFVHQVGVGFATGVVFASGEPLFFRITLLGGGSASYTVRWGTVPPGP